MCGCNHDVSNASQEVWHPENPAAPAPAKPNSGEIYRPEVLATIEARISELDEELRALSLDIHSEETRCIIYCPLSWTDQAIPSLLTRNSRPWNSSVEMMHPKRSDI